MPAHTHIDSSALQCLADMNTDTDTDAHMHANYEYAPHI